MARRYEDFPMTNMQYYRNTSIKVSPMSIQALKGLYSHKIQFTLKSLKGEIDYMIVLKTYPQSFKHHHVRNCLYIQSK
jgi:hypothetical protein